MDAAVRDRLLAGFAAYLDDVPETEAADMSPDGPDSTGAPDLFTLLAELGALKNEVKIESRQVKGALDEFRGAFDLMRQAQTRLEEAQVQRAEGERRARQDAERDLLLDLLDLRDRLQAGVDQAHRYRPGWFARRGGADAFVTSMSEGLAMNVRRLEESLSRRGVRPLRVVGTRFDPHTMHAAEVVRDSAQADGLVLAEIRRGFLQDKRLLRPAEVAVNRLTDTDP